MTMLTFSRFQLAFSIPLSVYPRLSNHNRLDRFCSSSTTSTTTNMPLTRIPVKQSPTPTSTKTVRAELTPAQLIQPPPPTGLGSQQSGQVRVRDHVNPLASRWRQPIILPSNWYETAYSDTNNPLCIDLGVAKGRFIYKLAQLNPDKNYLGLEIRSPLVHQANRIAASSGLTNLFYITCNANVSLNYIINGIPSDVHIEDIFIQFCDPWFKKRHAKRRMVNSPLVHDIYNAFLRNHNHSSTDSGGHRPGHVFLQSDVHDVAVEMKSLFNHHGGFEQVKNQDVQYNEDGWLTDNPIGVPTEREISVLEREGPVYRGLFKLNSQVEHPVECQNIENGKQEDDGESD